jgi:perosamine synthetase
MGSFGAFSFHGTKTMTTGEGGMFVTNDDALHERVKTLSNHGRAASQKKQFWPETLGYKYKLSNVQAAIGCGQLERIEELVGRKRAILQYYREHLERRGVVAMNAEPEGMVIGGWMPTVVLHPSTGVTRERMLATFASENIDARVFFHPLSSLPMFEKKLENQVAWGIPNRAMNLPTFHDMTDADQDRVIAIIKGLIG